MIERKRRMIVLALVIVLLCITSVYDLSQKKTVTQDFPQQVAGSKIGELPTGLATEALGKLEVKGRAPKTGYSRSQFGNGWEQVGACDVRNHILARDLTGVITRSETDCTVMQGTLIDPYTTKTILFVRGAETSDDVQIDHVVAMSDAWQKGAQQLSREDRIKFANDGLNLLAVDGPTNNKKSDSDAASWLPPNKEYRCQFVARQVAVKLKYALWVTEAEKNTMQRTLNNCPSQQLPNVLAS